MILITSDIACSWGCCYAQGRLRALYDRPHTAIDILERKDGPWDGVPADDRLWTVINKCNLTDRVLRLFAWRVARDALERERAAGREPDPRLRSAVEVAERHANGNATNEELAAALDAAWAAAWDAAWAAAWDAAWAAAWAAAWDAARAAQCAILAEIIRKEIG